MFREILLIFNKELKSYFVTPLVYIIFTVIFIISGSFFYNILVSYQTQLPEIIKNPWMLKMGFDELVTQSFFMQLSIIFLFFFPLLSMRIFAEENRSGTIEMLLTSPISQLSVIIGKFLAILFVFAIILGITISYFLLLMPYSNGVIKIYPLISSYIGWLLFGASLLSFGILASALTKSQLVASLIAFAFNLIFWIINSLSYYLTGTSGEFFSKISLMEHLQPFIKGVIDSRDIVYFVSIILIGLYLTNLSIESRRWRS